MRFVIKTILSIGNEAWEIEVTLTNRDSMGFRMLLGRQAMFGKTLVDPEASFIMGDLSKETLYAHCCPW
jgi:ribosomal protein S6--L-glutamate ligase